MIEADKIRQENEKKREELRRSYQRLFNTDDGKIVLNDLRLFCGQDRTSVCEQVPNELQTFFAEGKRRVFLRIQSMLTVKEVKNG